VINFRTDAARTLAPDWKNWCTVCKSICCVGFI